MEATSNLKKAFELIKSNFSKAEISGCKPVDKYLIEAAEKLLGVVLPSSYRKFIEDFGFGGVGSLLVSGIRCSSAEELESTGFVWGVLNDRQNFQYPPYIITVDDDRGDGSAYALDLSQMNMENECPVVIWPLNGYKTTPVLEVVAPDFGTWFLNKTEEQIRWKKEK